MCKRKQLPPPPDALGVLMLDARQVAAALNIGVSSLWKAVKNIPGVPKPIAITPRTVRWRASEVAKWAAGTN